MEEKEDYFREGSFLEIFLSDACSPWVFVNCDNLSATRSGLRHSLSQAEGSIASEGS
jgi:hypothetical protein